MLKILLVDDDPIVLKSFARLLTKCGYDIIAAGSYQDALTAINTEQFDLILSDIRMPGKNGVETVSDIQEQLKLAGKKEVWG